MPIVSANLFALTVAALLLTSAGAAPLSAEAPLTDALKQPILAAGTTQQETINLAEPKIPSVPDCRTLDEWKQHAERIRSDVLNHVVLRGVPQEWIDGPVNVEM